MTEEVQQPLAEVDSAPAVRSDGHSCKHQTVRRKSLKKQKSNRGFLPKKNLMQQSANDLQENNVSGKENSLNVKRKPKR